MNTLPKKKFYRMGEVCSMTLLEPHILRFWESEFPELSPTKTRTGQRTYTESNIDLIHRIKHLLYEDCYTIAGARKRLAGNNDLQSEPEKDIRRRKVQADITEIKGLIKNIINMLDRESGT